MQRRRRAHQLRGDRDQRHAHALCRSGVQRVEAARADDERAAHPKRRSATLACMRFGTGGRWRKQSRIYPLAASGRPAWARTTASCHLRSFRIARRRCSRPRCALAASRGRPCRAPVTVAHQRSGARGALWPPSPSSLSTRCATRRTRRARRTSSTPSAARVVHRGCAYVRRDCVPGDTWTLADVDSAPPPPRSACFANHPAPCQSLFL